DHSLNSKGMLCTWDLSAPSAPAAVMVSEGSPSCCCWAPAPSTTLLFAGMDEGGVCAWDLEEPDSRHPLEQVGGVGLFTRRPSYTTEYLADVATTAAPIVGIAATPRSEWPRARRPIAHAACRDACQCQHLLAHRTHTPVAATPRSEWPRARRLMTHA
ncbi:WD repeat domain-containing protein, partial [Tetrabaena socialis]